MLILSSNVPMGMVIRMTPSAVTLHSMSVMCNISWHSLVNPICEFVLDVMQALTPWIGSRGSTHRTCFHSRNTSITFSTCFSPSHLLTPCGPLQSKRHTSLAVIVITLLFVMVYNSLGDKYSRLKARLNVNLYATVMFPHRPHVLAAMLLCVCLKGIIVLGRPLHLFSLNVAPDVIKQWPQVIIRMLCVDLVIN